MKKPLVAGPLLLLVAPAISLAQTKFDGTWKADLSTAQMPKKRLNKNVIEETDKRDGKVISVARMTLGSDGKTISVDFHDSLRDTDIKYVAKKQ
jgi:hypothetical protein